MTDPLSYLLSLKTETVVIPLEPSLTSDTSKEEDTASIEDASVCTKADLGNPPMKFYTNGSEEMAFIREMKELIEDSQETEVVLTM